MRSKIKKYFIICWTIWIHEFKSKMSYRSDFIISIMGILITNICGFIFWKILFQNIYTIGSWEDKQILFIYGFTLISLSPVIIFFDNNWNLQSNVYSGDFIKYCTRPVNSFIYFFSEGFGFKGIGQLIIGIFVLNYALKILEYKLNLIKIILLIYYLVGSSFFMIAFHIIAGASCFWLINSGIILLFANDFKEFAKYPVTIFNNFFRFIFTFIIPIAFIGYYPCTIFLIEKPPILAYLTPLLGIIVFYISYKVWIVGAKNYCGTGS